jgi:hypothetical protein
MKQIFLAVLFSLAAVLCPAPQAAAKEIAQLADIPIESLAIQVVQTPSVFTVIDSRMDETGTAAVFFGLIGAAINSADNNSEDRAKAAPLLETAEAIDLDGLIDQALRTRLAAAPAGHLNQAPAPASHTLVVTITEWGLIRKAQKPDTSMRAFLKLSLSINDASGKPVWGPQRDHSVGQMTADLPAFTPDVFKTEIETLATRAGVQVANKMIYR